MTQIEQIKGAVSAIILAHGKDRFQIHLIKADGSISMLWPYRDQIVDKLLPYQIESTARNLPGWHFRLKGYGYSKVYELKIMLQRINPEIRVYDARGLYLSEHVF